MRTLSPSFRSLLQAWVWSFLVFGLLALVVVGQFAWTASLPAGEAWRMVARDWLPWAVLSPLLFRLVARFPLERPRWQVVLPVQVLCAITVVSLVAWWGEIVLPPPAQPPAPNHAAPGPTLPPHDSPSHRWLFVGLFFRLPIYLAVISVAHSVHFYRRSIARDSSLTQARLEALKMQLQPHFLFNSLNAIAELVHRDPDAADDMIAALSHLLRLSLETSGEQFLPLRRELDFVERYLAIEHVRFGDRLRFVLDVPPDTHAALVPAFLLQPLVENAVRHGLEPRAGHGILTLRARRERDILHLSVADNGVGLHPAQPLREGIGLGNTRARLHALFDGTAHLHLHQRDGLTVEITFPFRTATA